MGQRLRYSILLLVLLAIGGLAAQAQVRTRGIDVSKYQGKVNWAKVAKDSTIRFVYIKATEGTSIQDPYYRTNIAGARKAELLVGSGQRDDNAPPRLPCLAGSLDGLDG